MPVKLPKNSKSYDYDQWLDFFRRVPVMDLLSSQVQLKQKLSTEGFAAASRWIEIINSPSKIDKLYSAKLKAESDRDIMEVAVGDDDEAFYEALIRENVQQLNNSSTSTQEIARLTQNINIFRKELREIRARKPRKGTVLEQVLQKASLPVSKSRGGLEAKIEGKKKPAVRKKRTTAKKTAKKEVKDGKKATDSKPNAKN